MRKLLLTLLLLFGSLGLYAQSNLVIFNTNPNYEYEDGETLSFSVMVTNNGPSPAQNVLVYYPIPAGITISPGVNKFWWSGTNGSSGTNTALNNTIPSLGVNQTVTYTINIKIPNNYVAALPQISVTYLTQSDIQVSYGDGTTVYTPGTQAVYTITVVNNGPEVASVINVNNPIPAGITNFSWTGSNGTSGTNQNLQTALQNLPLGQVVTYTITVDVPAGFTGPLTNQLTVSGPFNDPTPPCAPCTDTDQPATGANIVVVTDNGQEVYTPGQQTVYTVTVTNNGPQDAANVVTEFIYSPGIVSINWTGDNGSSGNILDLTDTVGTLASGATVTYTVTVDVPLTYTGPLALEADVSSSTPDPDTSCPDCTDTDLSTSTGADIVVSHTLNSGTTFTPGANAVYTITVTNNGPGAATNVSIQDNVPAGITAGNVTWYGNGTNGTGNLQDVIDLLPAGQSVVYTFTVHVPSNFSQTTNLVNVVNVTSTSTDPDPSCPQCTITATPNPQANLVTLKTDFQSSYLRDSEVVYTISVTNPGPSDAYNVGVFDPVPYYIDFMQWSGDNVGGYGTMATNIPVLPAGQSAVYTVTIEVPEDYNTFVGNLTNTVTITSDTPDPVPACPGCTDTDTPRVKYVTVDKYAYTVQELVEDVLIDAECVNVSNISSQAGTLSGNYGIGYFHRNNSEFPIKDGIVLRCGNAELSQGPYGSPVTSSVASNAGDAELNAVSVANGQTAGINDVTYIQFNFVPLTDTMSFDFLFSSNEYGTYQCFFSDVFAFLLTDLTAPNPSTTNVNLAVIPGTSIPVSVTNIRNSLYNSNCGSANVAYFGQYNPSNPANGAINMMGQTVVMTASSPVVPGHTYKIKLAIGDYSDTAFDSAVWLAAGSFDIGQPTLPDNLTVANGTALCSYETYDLSVDAGGADFLYEWELDGETLLDDNGDPVDTNTITVSDPGVYTVLATYALDPTCQLTDTIKIEEIPDIDAQEPADLLIFDDGTVSPLVWDLTQNDAIVTEGLENPAFYYMDYYDNINGLEDGEAIPVFPNYAYAGTDGQTVYVAINGFENDCYTLKSFELYVLTPPDDINICKEAPFDAPEIVDLTQDSSSMFSVLQDPSNYTVTYHETMQGAEDGSEIIADPENYEAYPLTFTNNTKTIYVRVQDSEDPDSFAIWSFDLIISLRPAAVTLESISLCEPADPDNQATFDLTDKVNEILAASSDIDVELTLHATMADAQNNVNPLAYPTFVTTEDASQTVYFRASQTDAPDADCYTIIPLELSVSPAPQAQSPGNAQACDPENDGFETFDLTQYDGAILQGLDPDMFIVTYHQSAADADNNENAFSDPENYIANVGAVSVYVRLTNNMDEDCYSTTSFVITVTPTPVVVVPADGAACVNVGYALPPLTGDGNYFTGAGGTGTPLSAGTVLFTTQTVYVYAQSNTAPNNCTDEGSFQVTIYPMPAVPVITNYILCDDTNSGDGVETFDLTTKDAQVTGGNAGITAEYYLSQAAAQAGTNPIANPSAYQNTSSPQTIWAAAVSDFGCRSVASFQLIVNPLPVTNPDLEPFYACEEIPGEGQFDTNDITPEITMGASGYSVTYYDTQAGAQAGGPATYNGVFTAPTGTIYARVRNVATQCFVVVPVTLEVIPAPIAPDPAPLEECDFNLDQVATFNLNPVLQDIQNQLGAVTVTIHETYADAFYFANPIPNTGNYSNVQAMTTNGVQTLYIRVQSSQTECFDLVELQLIVHPVPVATDPEDYELCDNGQDDTDGFATFDLTTVESEVLGSLSPAQYSVSFYETPAAAQLGQSPVPAPGSYTTQSRTLYVRVTNNATGCYDIVELELIVNPLPEVHDPEPYTLCDENNPGDEQEEFDLTTKYEEIVDDLNGIVFTIHHSYADAQSGTGAIANPEAYTNSSTVETLFVRVTTEATGCYRIVLLDVRVAPLPVVYPGLIDEDLTTVCDEDGDGIGTFNLQDMIPYLINNGQDVEASFHWTAQDAQDNNNPITNLTNFHNITPFTQVIYVRASNSDTGCVSTQNYPVTLTVVPSPQVPDLQDITQCDDQDNNGQDNKAYFDLTVQDATIQAALGNGMTIHYFISEAYARDGAPRIVNPAHYYGTHQQVIWVRVEDPASECFGVTSFQLFLNQPLLLTTPSMYTICDDGLPNDGFATFNLTTKDEEILGPFGVGQNYTVQYFETETDQDNGNAIANPEAYENTDNAQTVFVTVTSEEGCKSYTTLTIKVLPLPTPDTTPDALELCDDNNSPDAVEYFNLYDAEADIRNNDNTTVISYHETFEDADQDTNPIADPSNYESGSATIYVRVEANTGNPDDEVCYQVVELQLIVNPLPELGVNGVIPPNAFCEDNTDGYHTFILNQHVPQILAAGLDPADYKVRFYYDQAAYDNGQALPNQYTNQVQGHQVILVYVQNLATGCEILAPLDLYVEEDATAYPVTDQSAYQQCDYDGDNDGVLIFDLTGVEPQVLGSQDPAQYSVAYYESMEDAATEANPIADPTAYQNSTPGDQTIYIRVTNTSTVSRCYDITTLDIHVEMIPEPQLQGGTICVDYDTQEVLSPLVLDSGLDDTHTFVWYYNGTPIAGADGPTYTATQAGSYTVEAVNAFGCVSDPLAPVTVERSGPASASQTTYAVSNAFSEDQVITIDVAGYGEGSYEFQLDYGPWQDSNVFTNVAPGLHEVHIRTTGDCSEYITTIYDVSIIDYPRFFTPNADGFHDTWNIYGLASQGDAKIYIFDRYGKLIKQISSQGAGWNGTYNGFALPADDYWFTVTFYDHVIKTPAVIDPLTGNEVTPAQYEDVQKEFKAHFSLKR